jgi:hypothetical protein
VYAGRPALRFSGEGSLKKRSLFVLATSLVLLFPVLTHADASVMQDSCVSEGPQKIRVYFTVYNSYLPTSICSFELIPSVVPPKWGCSARGCRSPRDWTGSLNSVGGAWFGAETGNPPEAFCIGPGESKGGFYVTLDPNYCCFYVTYYRPNGDFIMEEKECFMPCIPTPVEEKTWGYIKDRYND